MGKYTVHGNSIKILTVVIMVLLAFSLIPRITTAVSPDESDFHGGAGTVDNPYTISNWNHLNNVRYYPDAHFVLVSDLNEFSVGYAEHVATQTGWEPLGNVSIRFTGSFYGDHRTISNLYINRSRESIIGLFGFSNGEIRDLGLENVNITGNWYVGGLIGVNHGRVSNTYTTGNIKGYGYDIGGLIGVNYGNVDISRSSADIVGHGARVGGLIGNHNFADVVNTYASGTVEGMFQVGGLIGWVHWAHVSNSYSYGAVTGGGRLGGLIGQNWRGTIANSFWDAESSGMDTSNGGTAKSTAEMKSVDTYTLIETQGLQIPWDFVGNPNDDDGTDNIWDLDGVTNNGYPYFPWPHSAVYELTVYVEGEGMVMIDGAEVDIPYTREYSEGTQVQLECIPQYGWTFIEWRGDEYTSENSMTVTMDDDKEITAVLALEVWVDIHPKTLNMRSNGNWVTVYLDLPGPADIGSITMGYGEEEISAVWGEEQDLLMVKFLTSEVQDMVEPGYIELVIRGELQSGTLFIGYDTIRVINPGR